MPSNFTHPFNNNIPTEAFETDIEVTTNMLHVLFVKIWWEEQAQANWKDAYFIKIQKKGDISTCENYKGITLLSIPAKVFTSVSELSEELRRRITFRSPS